MNALIQTRRQRAMVIFLTADAVIFLTLLAVYIYLRAHASEWPVALHFASGLMAFAMTLFAVAGSFTMTAAARESTKGNTELPVRLIVATIACWGTFLILDAMEWLRLMMFEHPWRIPNFGATFFLLSGYQLLHVIGGLAYLLAVAVNVKRSDVGAAALFVHFSNALWLILFVALYLSNADLRGL